MTKNVQDLALELSKVDFSNIGNNGCCAFVFLWCLGIEPDNPLENILLVQEALNKKYIMPDCTVKWIEWGKALTGRNITVDFIDNFDIKKIKERTPVLFSIDGKSGHWVGVEKGKIAYNPKGHSKNVEKGKPITMRKINILGVVK